MKGILKSFGAMGSLAFVAIFLIITGLTLPFLDNTGKTVILMLLLVSVFIAYGSYGAYDKVVEERGWKAVFHPLTFTFIASLISLKGFAHILSILG